MDTLRLERFSYAPDGTYGRLYLPDGTFFWTVERPWLGNKPFESCIPEGTYLLIERHSPVVRRTSGGEFEEGWEVTDVPERNYIMIHPGNFPYDVQGCIAVGLDYQSLQGKGGKYYNAVTNSRDAFRKLMQYLESRNEWQLEITGFYPSYP